MEQIIGADRAAFVKIAEKISALKRDSSGELPMDKELANLESDSSINFRLLTVPSVKIKKTPLESNQISLIRYTRRVKERAKGNPQRS